MSGVLSSGSKIWHQRGADSVHKTTGAAMDHDHDDEATVTLARPLDAIPLLAPTRLNLPSAPLPDDWLRKVSRREIALTNRLLAILPSEQTWDTYLNDITSTLSELLGEPCELKVRGVRGHVGSRSAPAALTHGFITSFEFPPDMESGIFACDPTLASLMLGALLKESPPPPPFDPQEHGVLCYVLLRVIARLSEMGNLPPCSIHSEPLRPEEIEAPWRSDLELAEVALTMRVGDARGWVRIFLPAKFLATLEVFAQAARTSRPLSLVPVIAPARATGAVIIARLCASRAALSALMPGDVLLPSEHGLAPEIVAVPTPAHAALVIDGAHAVIEGALSPSARDSSLWSLTVAQFDTPLRRYKEFPMNKQDTPSPDMEVNGPIGGQAELVVEVHIAQVRLPVSQLNTLQSGQIIDLGVPLSQPVSLVVDGRLLGSGELVDVEGRLGVRVLKRA